MATQTDPTVSRFLDNYYAWSVQQVLREVSLDFASLRAVRGLGAAQALRALQKIDAGSRIDLMVARLKLRHGRAVTPREQELVSRYKQVSQNIPGYTILEEVKGVPAAQKDVRRRIRESGRECQELLGTMESGGEEFSFRLEVGGHRITTVVDTGGRSRQLEYGHIVLLRGSERPITAPFHVMAWLGFSSATQWDMLVAGEEDDAVRKMLSFSKTFIDAFPALVTDA